MLRIDRFRQNFFRHRLKLRAGLWFVENLMKFLIDTKRGRVSAWIYGGGALVGMFSWISAMMVPLLIRRISASALCCVYNLFEKRNCANPLRIGVYLV